MADASTSTIARRALRCLDLTDLSETCSDHAIDALCAKAKTAEGPVAAVCVWPQFVSRARAGLEGSPVRVATVVNFPAGGEDVGRVVDDVSEALSDGAQEIDLVIPYGALRRGEFETASEMVAAVRDVVDRGRLLKAILETGELVTPALIDSASRLAIEAGADFIKTSTGKSKISATLDAARIMLDVIKTSRRPVGLKPSGGIRTPAEAGAYLALADEVMGADWATPKTFRIGASSVYDALLAAAAGRESAAGGWDY